MNITTRAKTLIGAVALAGAVGVTGSAFTSTGVTNNAGASQFVGGTVSQTVAGATLSNIGYEFTDGTNTAINKVVLTFADADANGKAAAIVFTAGTPVDFTCTTITAASSACTPTVADTSQTGASGVAVTVS